MWQGEEQSEDNEADGVKTGGSEVRGTPARNPFSCSHNSRLTFGSSIYFFVLLESNFAPGLSSRLKNLSIFHIPVTPPTDKASCLRNIFPHLFHAKHDFCHASFIRNCLWANSDFISPSFKNWLPKPRAFIRLSKAVLFFCLSGWYLLDGKVFFSSQTHQQISQYLHSESSARNSSAK